MHLERLRKISTIQCHVPCACFWREMCCLPLSTPAEIAFSLRLLPTTCMNWLHHIYPWYSLSDWLILYFLGHTWLLEIHTKCMRSKTLKGVKERWFICQHLVSKRCLKGNYCAYFTEYVWIDWITYIFDMLSLLLLGYNLASMKCKRCTRIKKIKMGEKEE